MNTYQLIFEAIGTVIQLQITDDEGPKHLEQAKQIIARLAQLFSANQQESELMRLNRSAGKARVKVSNELFQLIATGKKHSEPEASYLNIAIGPLVKAWRIGFADAHKPSDQEIEKLLQRTNPTEIHLFPETNEVLLGKEQMEIDLGCIAKGEITDYLVAYFQQEGVQTGIVDLGGNVRVFGTKSCDYPHYQIGIANPFVQTRVPLFTLHASDKAVVTSGSNERFFEINGKRYHHILDNRTGYPIETDLVSITIIADKAIDGEIWTTRLFGFSAIDAMKRIEQQPGIEGMVIRTDGMVAFSSGIQVKENELHLL